LPRQYHVRNTLSKFAVMGVTYLMVYGPANRTNNAVITAPAGRRLKACLFVHAGPA